jgi:hypothetical protein
MAAKLVRFIRHLHRSSAGVGEAKAPPILDAV